MKNIRSISIVALPLMLLLSTVNVNAIIPTAVDGEMLEGIAAHNAPTVKGRVDAAKDLALAHPYISAAVAAAALGAGYISYKMYTKKPATDLELAIAQIEAIAQNIASNVKADFKLDESIKAINETVAQLKDAKLVAAVNDFVSLATIRFTEKTQEAGKALIKSYNALKLAIKAYKAASKTQSIANRVAAYLPSKKVVAGVALTGLAGYFANENGYLAPVKSGIKSAFSKVSNWFSKSAKQA